MKWFAKAMAFKAMDKLPGGERIHHGLQRLTGSIVPTEERLANKVEQTLRYWRWLESNTSREWLATASHLELGSGWVPNIPITLYALGAPRQHLVDIRRNMQPEAVIRTVELFRAIAPRTGAQFARIPEVPPAGEPLETMLNRFGMSYAAPYDELADKVAGTVGYITASYMMLHLDRATLMAILRNMRRLLGPGGYLLAQHHLRQLFDGLESRTSPFFSLRYSDWFWENIINSRTMSYNRLKARDYKEALEEAGFQVVLMDVEPGRPEDFGKLRQARIHPSFSCYTEQELAARHLFFVAQKPR